MILRKQKRTLKSLGSRGPENKVQCRSEKAEGFKDSSHSFQAVKNAPPFAPARRGDAKAGEILCRERIYAFPTVLQQACPVLDTGEDEGWRRDE